MSSGTALDGAPLPARTSRGRRRPEYGRIYLPTSNCLFQRCQRLPPPCATQYPVSPRAIFAQPSSSHCRLLMALLQAHSTEARRNPNSLSPQSQPSPTPLSVLNALLGHTGH